VLGRLATIVKWLVLLPVLAAVALMAVANDHRVTVNFNPFEPADPVLQVELALYQIAFAVFVLGALVGAFVAWKSQLGRRRRRRAADERLAASRAEAAKPAGGSALVPTPGRPHRA
jgi:ABC-type uncharacterized transport system permease subunit